MSLGYQKDISFTMETTPYCVYVYVVSVFSMRIPDSSFCVNKNGIGCQSNCTLVLLSTHEELVMCIYEAILGFSDYNDVLHVKHEMFHTWSTINLIASMYRLCELLHVPLVA